MVDYSASRNDFRFLDDNGTEYNAGDDDWARRLNSDFRGLRGLAKVGRNLGAGRLQIHNTFDLDSKGIPGLGNNQSLHTRYATRRHIAEATLFGPLRHRAGYRLQAHHSLSEEEYRDLRGEVGVGRQHDRNLTRSLGLRGEVNALLAGRSLVTAFGAARRESFAPGDLLRPESRLLRSRRRALAAGTRGGAPPRAAADRQRRHPGRSPGRPLLRPQGVRPQRRAAEPGEPRAAVGLARGGEA